MQTEEEVFIAAYSPSTSMGVVRAFPRTQVPGVKLFAFSSHFTDRGSYTDDDSQYFEMWGGVPATFWEQDNAVLEPGGVMEWTERWYPFTAIGPPVYANRQSAFNWRIADGALIVGLATTAPRTDTLSLVVDGEEILRQAIWVSPEAPFQQSAPLPADVSESAQLTMRFVDQAGQLTVEYRRSIDQ